jgi:hypothetical protein
MKMKIRYIFLIFGFITLIWNPVRSGSYYNSNGLGDIKYFTNAQAIGMGGTLIAVVDQFQINVLNPAALTFIPLTRLSGDFIHEAIWSQAQQANGFVKYTNLNGISLAIPLKTEKLVTSISIIPSSKIDYEYSVPDTINSFGYDKRIKASGGLNNISFGFGLAITKNIYWGNYLHVNFGKIQQTWSADFVSDLFWDANNRLTRRMWGINWTGGLIIRPTSHLFLGAIYSSKYKLNYNEQTDNFTQQGSLIYTIDKFKTDDLKTTIPELWGLGASYILEQKYRLSTDFLYQPWSDFTSENSFASNYNNSYRLGFGIEMLPNTKNMLAKYYERMSYRVGYFYHQLNFQDKNGSNVTEYGINVGAGFPYYGNWGRVDVALRFGQRGNLSSNPVKENIFQIFVSVSGGEKWFFRGN